MSIDERTGWWDTTCHWCGKRTWRVPVKVPPGARNCITEPEGFANYLKGPHHERGCREWAEVETTEREG